MPDPKIILGVDVGPDVTAVAVCAYDPVTRLTQLLDVRTFPAEVAYTEIRDASGRVIHRERDARLQAYGPPETSSPASLGEDEPAPERFCNRCNKFRIKDSSGNCTECGNGPL